MIQFKNNKLRIRCLECKNEHFVEVKHIGTERQERSLEYEYEYIFKGILKCSHCGEKMKIIITVFEYPKGQFNYCNTDTKSCLIMDTITEDSFNLI